MQTKYDEVTMGPLQGIRVLELTQAVAGPSCGRILAEMGAEVFKIESLEGDPYRNTNTVVPNEGKRFQSLNLGKKSIAIYLSYVINCCSLSFLTDRNCSLSFLNFYLLNKYFY